MRAAILLLFAAALYAQPISPPPCTASRKANCTINADSSGNTSFPGNATVGATSSGGAGTSISPTTGISGYNFIDPIAGKTNRRGYEAGISLYVPNTILNIGDSWSTQQWFVPALTTALQNRYGNMGVGWVNAGTTTLTQVPQGFNFQTGALTNLVTRSSAGTWTEQFTTGTTVVGPSCLRVTSSDVATPASMTWATLGTDTTQAKIYYLQQPGGGSFTWAVDGGGATTVSTAGTLGIGVVTISGLSVATHSFVVTVTVAGSAGVTLNGIDLIGGSDNRGIRVENIGMSGTTTGDWASVSAATWQTAVGDIAVGTTPIVLVTLGTNDERTSVALTTSAANLATIVTNLRAALTTPDIYFVAPGDNGTGSTAYTMATWRNFLQQQANTLGVGFIDAYTPLSPYALENARGLYHDANHPNLSGGYIVANAIYRELTGESIGQWRNFSAYNATFSGTTTLGAVSGMSSNDTTTTWTIPGSGNVVGIGSVDGITGATTHAPAYFVANTNNAGPVISSSLTEAGAMLYLLPKSANANNRNWGLATYQNTYDDFCLSTSNAKSGNPITAASSKCALYLRGSPGNYAAAVGGVLQLTAPSGTPTTLAQPTCNAAAAGTLWYSGHTASAKDSVAVCAADATDTYAWRTIY